MIKNGADITKMLMNNCHFTNLIEGADTHAQERVCQFLGHRLEELGYVLVHSSDLIESKPEEESTSDERKTATGSTLTLLNISNPEES
jgi:hypothetical protein